MSGWPLVMIETRPGFASTRGNRIDHYSSINPDFLLLDAAGFVRFKVLFAEACLEKQFLRESSRGENKEELSQKSGLNSCKDFLDVDASQNY